MTPERKAAASAPAPSSPDGPDDQPDEAVAEVTAETEGLEPDDGEGDETVNGSAADDRPDPEVGADPLAVALLERSEYLDGMRRVQAEFENYRKRVVKQQTDHLERAAEALVDKLLPVLDACDAAIQQGEEAVVPIRGALLDVLTRDGLERDDPAGEPFDPNRHEAVMHEEADADAGPDDEVATVVEVLRTGYSWKGRIVRPAMVKVKG